MSKDPSEPESAEDLSPNQPDVGRESVLRIAYRQGIGAIHQFKWPAIFLWALGTVIVVSYYFIPQAKSVLETIGAWKTEVGLLFSAFSTAVFGGTIPSLLTSLPTSRKQATDSVDTADPSSAVSPPSARPSMFLVSNTLFWAYKGIEVDLLYQMQDLVFGGEIGLGTIFAKATVDQFLYAPTFGLANVVLFYQWRKCGYSFSSLRQWLTWRWYREHVLPLLISNWLVWLPAVMLIYCLPLALQIPVQNLVLCFWVLVIYFFANTR